MTVLFCYHCMLMFVLIQGCVLARNYGYQALGHLGPQLFHSLSAESLEGKTVQFHSFKGKVVMITNVASECGYTAKNYEQLRLLKEKFGGDLAIVLIPSNDFGEQEPGSPEEIRGFINEQSGQDYIVLKRSSVNGPEEHSLIGFLKSATTSQERDISWNFETKFIVSSDGKTVSRYSDAFEPIKLIESIKYFIRNRNPEEL